MILEFITSHPYYSVFIGLVIGGESVLLPALYLATQKVLSIEYVWGLSLLATAISDTVWYYIGYKFSLQRLSGIPFFKKHIDTVHILSRLFRKHGLLLIFISKFVYGTRVASQVLSGSIKISFIKYFFVNMAGVIALNSVFTVLAYTVTTSLSQMEDYVYAFEVGFLILIIFIILTNILIRYHISKKWFH